MSGRRRAVAFSCGVAVALCGGVSAADSLFDLGEVQGYGGPYVRVTTLRGEPALSGGGPLGMMFLDRRWAVGAVWESAEGDLEGRWPTWVGARVEHYLLTTRWVHVSVGDLLGGGGLVRTSSGAGPGASFVVVEPDVTIALQIVRTTRLALTGGYRFVPYSSDATTWTGRDLSGPFVGLALQDGNFDALTDPRARPPSVQLSGFVSEKLTWIAGEPTWMDGGGTRLLLGRYLAVGVTGYSSRHDVSVDGQTLGAGYGGVETAVTLNPVGPVRVVPGLVVAIGGAGPTSGAEEDSSAAVFLEPEVFAETDMVDFMRLGLGAGYRFALCIQCNAPLSGARLGGPMIAAQLRFGSF